MQGNASNGLLATAVRLLAASRKLRERAFFNVLIDEMLPHGKNSGRAVDIGCGSGSLMSRLSRVGWTVEGVEWDETAAEIAHTATGLPVWHGDILRVGLQSHSYDLVILSHVIEHIPDPLAALSRIKDLLAPDGRAVLVYPNPASLGAILFRDAWFPWEVPRHLVLPPPDSLAAAVERIGLRPLGWRTMASAARGFLAHSKCYLAKRRVDELAPHIGTLERILAAIEMTLVELALPVGEEVVLALEKEIQSIE